MPRGLTKTYKCSGKKKKIYIYIYKINKIIKIIIKKWLLFRKKYIYIYIYNIQLRVLSSTVINTFTVFSFYYLKSRMELRFHMKTKKPVHQFWKTYLLIFKYFFLMLQLILNSVETYFQKLYDLVWHLPPLYQLLHQYQCACYINLHNWRAKGESSLTKSWNM